jgi:transcriptional regulator of arginine metabolism
MKKRTRQKLIRELIGSREIRTQEVLSAALKRKNVRVTQATLSRDFREMGVIKKPEGLGGFAYKIVLEEAPTSERNLQHKFAGTVREARRSANLIILKTPPGEAQGVARVIDNARIDGLLGTVAGDDTILVVTGSETDAKKIVGRFNKFITPA